MKFLLRIWATFILAVKRLFSQWRLALAAVLGVMSCTVLIMSIPIYVDAIYYRLLRRELSGRFIYEEKSPFAFTFHYIGPWAGSVRWRDIQPADSYLSGSVVSDIGLPRQMSVRFIRTRRLMLYPKDTIDYDSLNVEIAPVDFGFITDLREHIQIVEGVFPTAASSQGSVAVLVSESLAEETGLQIGEIYVTYASREEGKDVKIPVRIAGVWRPTDSRELYWFRKPRSLHEVLLVPEKTLLGRIKSETNGQIREVLWYLVTDGSHIRTSQVGSLIGRLRRVRTKVSSLLPKIIITSPLKALVRYRWSARLTGILLHIISIPVIGLNLIFINLVTRMAIERQRGEIAVMRSRGATKSQMVGIAALEGLVIGLLALLLGLPTSMLVAHLATRTRTFLDFSAHANLHVRLNPTALRLGLTAAGLGIVTRVVPTIGASEHTVVTYKQKRSRVLHRPFWQRIWVALLLLAPAAYGTYLLKQQGGVFLPVGVEGMTLSDPFQNPILFLVPSLTILALALIITRVLPVIGSLLAWIASRTRSVSFLLATRHFSRTPGFYAAPMLLLIVTLSLSVLFSSTARTLDDHLYNQIRYNAGAEVRLVPEIQLGGSAGEGRDLQASDRLKMPNWFYVPMEGYRKVSGVEHVARVARYRCVFQGNPTEEGTFMAIDRVGFSEVAFWRSSFAPASLGWLMNRLGTARNGVLLPRDFMRAHALSAGDSIHLSLYFAH